MFHNVSVWALYWFTYVIFKITPFLNLQWLRTEEGLRSSDMRSQRGSWKCHIRSLKTRNWQGCRRNLTGGKERPQEKNLFFAPNVSIWNSVSGHNVYLVPHKIDWVVANLLILWPQMSFVSFQESACPQCCTFCLYMVRNAFALSCNNGLNDCPLSNSRTTVFV